MRKAEVMAAGCEVNLLGDDTTPSQKYGAKAIEIGTISNTGLMLYLQMPGDLNTRTLVDEWPPRNVSAKKPQPEQSPGIKRFWRPDTKNRPAKLPKEQAKAESKRPGTGCPVLLVICHIRHLAEYTNIFKFSVYFENPAKINLPHVPRNDFRARPSLF